MTKKLEMTGSLRQKYFYLFGLQKALELYMKPTFWSTPIIESKKVNDFVWFISSAQADLWNQINIVYPETKGTDATANGNYITYEIPDEALS